MITVKKQLFKEIHHKIILPNKNNDLYFKYFSDIHKSIKEDESKLYCILDRLYSSYTDYVGIGGDIIDITNDIRENNNERKILIDWLKEISNHYKTFKDMADSLVNKNHTRINKNNIDQLIEEKKCLKTAIIIMNKKINNIKKDLAMKVFKDEVFIEDFGRLINDEKNEIDVNEY